MCKLYDISSLPKPFANIKGASYVVFVFIVTSFTIYNETLKRTTLLNELDLKYKDQYNIYVKSHGYEGVV
jgi:hypothetical protein